MRDDGFPARGGGRVGLRFQSRALELMEEIGGGGVGEAQVGAGEILIEDGSAEEAS